jgi:hypothetical protein
MEVEKGLLGALLLFSPLLGRYGISLSGDERRGLFIQHIDRDACVDPPDSMRPGDRILAFNLKSTFQLSHAQAISMIHSFHSKTIHVILFRYQHREYLEKPCLESIESYPLLHKVWRLKHKKHRRALSIFDFVIFFVHTSLSGSHWEEGAEKMLSLCYAADMSTF